GDGARHGAGDSAGHGAGTNISTTRVLPPPRLFVRADAERDLADNLVRQQRVGWMEPPSARVAEQPLELALLEHPEAARQIERAIDDAERGFDGSMLARHDPQEPVGSDPTVRSAFVVDSRPGMSLPCSSCA